MSPKPLLLPHLSSYHTSPLTTPLLSSMALLQQLTIRSPTAPLRKGALSFKPRQSHTTVTHTNTHTYTRVGGLNLEAKAVRADGVLCFERGGDAVLVHLVLCQVPAKQAQPSPANPPCPLPTTCLPSLSTRKYLPEQQTCTPPTLLFLLSSSSDHISSQRSSFSDHIPPRLLLHLSQHPALSILLVLV